MMLVLVLTIASASFAILLKDKEETMRNNVQNAFSASVGYLDKNLYSVMKTATEISLGKHVLSSLSAVENTSALRNGIMKLYEELRQFTKTAPFEMHPFLYFSNTDIVVSEKGSCNLTSFCYAHLTDSEEILLELLRIQAEKQYQAYLPSQDYLIVCSSLPLIRSSQDSGQGLSCVFLPYSVFYSTIPDLYLFPDEVGIVLIQKNSGRILYQNALSTNYIPETDTTAGDWECLTCELPNCSLKMVLLFPSSALLDANASVRRFVITSFFILLLLGVVLSFVLSVRNYHPIKKVAALTGQKSDNELHAIASSLSHLQKEKTSLQLRLESYYTEKQEQIICSLLSESNNAKALNDLQELSGGLPEFPLVIACISGFDNSKKSIEAVHDFWNSQCKTTENSKILEYKGKLVAIFHTDSTERACAIFNELTGIVEQLLAVRWLVGISRPISQVQDISKACREAEHIIDYASLLGSVGVYSIDALPGKAEQKEIITLADYMRLQCAIRNREFDKADQIFDDVCRVSFSQGIPLSLLRCRFFGLINTLVLALSLKTDAEQYKQIRIPDELLNCNSVQDLVRSTKKVLEQIKKIVESQENQKRQNQQESIYNYIMENYSNPNLNVSAIANHFGISSSNISRMFRGSGSSILDLIHGVRIRHAQELLRNTELSIHQIGIEVGYIGDQSFFRSFKKYTGFSPGTYRTNDITDGTKDKGSE